MSLTTHSGHVENKMKYGKSLRARASISIGIKPREKVHYKSLGTFNVRLDSKKPDLDADGAAHYRAVGLTGP